MRRRPVVGGMLGPLGGLVDAFGPFLIPVAIFVAGLLGYAVLFLLNRYT